MTSRQRLMAVLNGEMPDRVPISTYELCACNSESFENREPSYRSLMDFIRANTDAITMWNPPRINGMPQGTVETTVTDEGGYHVRRTVYHAPGRDLTSTTKFTNDVKTTWTTEHICKDTDDVDAWLSLPDVPAEYSKGDYDRIISELGDHGIVMASASDPICIAMEIMEFGEGTIWATSEPDHFKATLDELHRRIMRDLRRELETCPVDLYRICGPEYCTPPYLSPEQFERFVYPYLCEMVELIHSFGKKVRIHSHGKVGRVLDMILDTGADAIDPCEAPPDGDIELRDLKAKAAGRMAVFGNLQLKLLEKGSEEQVRQAVRVCMDSAKEGGGYVIMPTASPINIPLSPQTERNYMAFIDEARRLGAY